MNSRGYGMVGFNVGMQCASGPFFNASKVFELIQTDIGILIDRLLKVALLRAGSLLCRNAV